ncbi:GSCFA domain-containing protein [Halocola ammonii]
MKFRTEINPAPSPFEINLTQDQMFVGSCFSEHMSSRLSDLAMEITANPHGILFNPVSVVHSLTDLIEKKVYSEKDLDEVEGKFVSFMHHGSFSGSDKAEVLERINKSIKNGRAVLGKAQTLFITLGSAWAYRHIEKNKFVANCHKVPQKEFDKELISHDRAALVLQVALEKLFKLNENLQVVFTVSPVRHWKDGFAENQLSKSHLTILAHKLSEAFEQVHYFPAYELVMDDLRDYRFFESDLLHPNKQAQDYIWEKFQTVFFSASDREKIVKIENINRSLAHKPTEEKDEDFQNWRRKLIAQKAELLSK